MQTLAFLLALAMIMGENTKNKTQLFQISFRN